MDFLQYIVWNFDYFSADLCQSIELNIEEKHI
jgi:hypothetical protein